MATTVEQVFQQALTLPPEEIDELIDRLSDERLDADVRQHLAEVYRRAEELRTGAVKSIPGPEVQQSVRRKLASVATTE